MSYAQLFKVLIPELIVLLAGLLLLALDLGVLRNKILVARVRIAAFIACLGLVAAFLWIIGTQTSGRIAVWDGMLVLDQLTSLGKQIVLIVSAIVVIVSVGSRFTSHVGEYFLLLLLATIGMMFLVASENILVIFVSLELLSLSLYIMTAFNKQSLQSAEAALKYFLFGGMSAAFMLFGLSLLFGASGELNLVSIASKLKGAPVDPLVVVAIIMVVVGFGFKIAAVPFHLWAPDTYQAAPLPAATFIASASKVASFFILTKVLLVGFAGAEGSVAGRHWVQGWMPLIATIAAASMVLGNLAAIAQKSVRRLLAYSAIAQAGYILVGVLANDQNAVSSMLYYVTTYGLTVIGAFAVLSVLGDSPEHDRLGGLAGFAKREPLLSLCMLIFLLSLAGIPPLAGFFGKFYLFAAALNGPGGSLGLLWLVALALAMSTVSLYYYLQVLKQIYVVPGNEQPRYIRSTVFLRLLTLFLALAVLVLGMVPGIFLGKARPAAAALVRP
jgi:NADH-quinone oxidoreductase subunit N